MTATDAALMAQRLLRDGRWSETAPEGCKFFIGYLTATTCKRCGSRRERTIPATDGER